jgi:hypothetical protein
MPFTLTLPVSETDPVVVGSTSEIENDTEEQKTDENQNFAGRHPEFNFSEEGDTEDVDCQDDGDNNRTDCAYSSASLMVESNYSSHSPPDGNIDTPIGVPVCDDDDGRD